MRVLIDRFMGLCKWPVAVYMLLSLPAYVQSFYTFSFTSWKFAALAMGLGLFFFSRTMADAVVRTNIQIVAHECTHAFFAILTLHKVKRVVVEEDNSGGHMAFEGEGNWLIVIAPYFFPLFCFFIMIGVSIYTCFAPMNLFVNGVIGYFIGYHIDAVASQIHEKQTDLPKVGYKFCLLFLPSANLWAIGTMLAFNSRGWEGVWLYQRIIGILNGRNYDELLRFIVNVF